MKNVFISCVLLILSCTQLFTYAEQFDYVYDFSLLFDSQALDGVEHDYIKKMADYAAALSVEAPQLFAYVQGSKVIDDAQLLEEIVQVACVCSQVLDDTARAAMLEESDAFFEKMIIEEHDVPETKKLKNKKFCTLLVTNCLKVSGNTVINNLTVNGTLNACGRNLCLSMLLSGTSCDFPDTLVLRDDIGNFSATTITLTGNVLVNYSPIGGCDIGSGFIFAPTNENTIIGLNAGNNNMLDGNFNTIIGNGAMAAATTGCIQNVAIGSDALSANAHSQQNVAVGSSALSSYHAQSFINGQNVAVGFESLGSLARGTQNSAFGYNSGLNYADSESYNIVMGTQSVSGDNQVIRIGLWTTNGDPITTTSCFIAGIIDAPITGGVNVYVNAAGQLGVMSSSARYKTAIKDMGDATADLINLRPVIFNYKQDTTGKREYGLIAEEVSEYFPDIVISKDGEIETVQYQYLPVMLLNEWKKDHERIAKLEQLLHELLNK